MPELQRRWALQKLTGFTDRSNFRYYAFLSTVSSAFILWMFRSMFIKTMYCNPTSKAVSAPPGECYWYLKPNSRYYWGIQSHLSTCFPALILAILQFTPSIRKRFPSYHRWAGRLAMILGLITSISPFLWTDVAMGGTWATISLVWTLGPMALWGHYKGWTAIRAGDVHLHRRWMLRTWSWLGCAITARPMIFILVVSVSKLRNIFPLSIKLSCEKLLWMTIHDDAGPVSSRINLFKDYARECIVPGSMASLVQLQSTVQAALTNSTYEIPPSALAALRPGAMVLVPASLASKRIDQAVAALSISFGFGTWIALLLHVLLAELYLSRTTVEDNRLRKVSDMRRRNRQNANFQTRSEKGHDEEKKTL